MLNVIAIGGGELGQGETLKLDETIVRCTGKTHPTALFIPTDCTTNTSVQPKTFIR